VSKPWTDPSYMKHAGESGAFGILATCENPTTMRWRAAIGKATPCYRCLAVRDTPGGCFFVDRLREMAR
jgi:hypothetical protein